MSIVQQGDTVQVHYEKCFQNGSIVSSRRKPPIEVIIGVDHRRLPGLELALVGMAVGESKMLLVPAQQAYGAYDPTRIYRLPHTRFVGHKSLFPGKWLRICDRRHRRRLVRIVEVRANVVIVDTNHRWAGQSMELKVEVIAIHACQATRAPDERTAGPAHDAQQELSEGLWFENGG